MSLAEYVMLASQVRVFHTRKLRWKTRELIVGVSDHREVIKRGRHLHLSFLYSLQVTVSKLSILNTSLEGLPDIM
jgi:hypothetical protein